MAQANKKLTPPANPAVGVKAQEMAATATIMHKLVGADLKIDFRADTDRAETLWLRKHSFTDSVIAEGQVAYCIQEMQKTGISGSDAGNFALGMLFMVTDLFYSLHKQESNGVFVRRFKDMGALKDELSSQEILELATLYRTTFRIPAVQKKS